MMERWLAIVNPAAGDGRCGREAARALDRLRAAGLDVEAHESGAPGEASRVVRKAYGKGVRQFLAVGGDGTAFEIVNGLFPGAETGERPSLGFAPLGTGNSFLRDFTERGPEAALEALVRGRERPCDVIRLRHRAGVLHYINLLSLGFAADVAATRQRRFRRWGELGYLAGVFVCLARLHPQTFPLRVDGETTTDRRGCLFLSFNNSKFTGGKMMIAPEADPTDGLLECVRWGPIGRLGLIRNLPGLYDGSHIRHPLASRRAARRIDFELDGPVNVMVDGEVMELDCQSLEVLPGALAVRI
jgi:diacylglycerol kinase (ATP)